MTKGLMSIALAALLASAGCAGRKPATLADVTPAGVPRSAPQPTPSQPGVKERPVTGTGSANRGAAPATVMPPSVAPNAPAATNKAAAGEAPPATASPYVYSPQQAVSATPSRSPEPSPHGTAPPALPKSAPRTAAQPQGQDDSLGRPAGELQLLVVVSASAVATGEVMTVDVMASSSAAVVDAPLHLTSDPNVLEFVDGTPGDFLTQGGSSVVFLADGRSRPGDVAIAAGRVSRESGASGSGLLCRVRFRGVGVGTTAVSVGQAKAWGTQGEELTVRSVGTTVVVR